jgi:predicted nucleic acid-binding protein
MIVLDSSAAVDLLTSRESRDWVETRIADDPDVHIPHLLDVEVASALRQMVTRGAIEATDAQGALDDLADLDVARYPHVELLDRVWELRTHLSAYDGVYVALAEVLEAALVTTDARLARSHGHAAHIVSP